jgi:hypothetical protein
VKLSLIFSEHRNEWRDGRPYALCVDAYYADETTAPVVLIDASRGFSDLDDLLVPRFVTLTVKSRAEGIRRAVEFADLWFADGLDERPHDERVADCPELTVPCECCGAAIGAQCVGADPRAQSHSVRFRAWDTERVRAVQRARRHLVAD